MTGTPPMTPTEDQSQVAAFDRHAPLKEATLRRLYHYMLKCRTVEERIRLLFRQGRFSGNYFAAVGQEATEVGATMDLLPEDTIAPSHRNFVTHIMKGTPLNLMFAHIFLRKDSPDQGRCAQAHCGYAPLNIITPASTIAAQLAIGTGVALANKMQKKTSVVVALSGEGATSLGLWHQSLNFAGVHICRLSTYWRIICGQNRSGASKCGRGFQHQSAGIWDSRHTVDGNDVVAVYKAAQEAIHRARQGDGPTLIECKTYRWYGHSEIDPAKYRTVEELEYWKSAIRSLPWSATCRSVGSGPSRGKKSCWAEFNKEIDEAIEFAEKSPYPEPEEALDHVFSFSIRERELNRKVWAPQISSAV